jgi:probable rRNA maturation factor
MNARGDGRRSGGPALQVAVVDGAGRSARRAAPGLEAWLVRAAPRQARGAVTIALIGDQAMRRLNGTFRGRDAATDVLSFPAEDGTDAAAVVPAHPVPAFTRRALGDIAIATGVARRQAAAHHHSLATEVRILALHGLLHLLGYDHERDQGRMRQVEERLRRRAGLPTGLIARAPGPNRQ